jgi:catechol 2,3-dioxygenase-like lactoylglutathione lyase family enzyme/ketosteroid isomerase-like protein
VQRGRRPQDQPDRRCPELDRVGVSAGKRVRLNVERLDHLVLTVRDLDATVEFYRRVLGMEVVAFGEGRTAVRFGDQKINLHPVAAGMKLVAARPTPGSGDICLLTDEPLAAWLTHLTSCGVAVEAGPGRRTGARGPIESIYLRDPDGNLVEISNEVVEGDPIAPLRDWLRQLQACVRAQDFTAGRALCAPDMLAFGTKAEMVEGIDEVMKQQWQQVWPRIREFTIDAARARGAIHANRGWVAARWDSLGVRPDGSTFPRPGRLTILFARRGGRWLATHTHFSLSPTS